MSKEKLIPELRFPEFKNEGEWFRDALINIAKFRRGSFPQPYGLPEWYDDVNGMPFIQVYDVGDNFRLKPKAKSKISKLAAEQSVFIPKGTVIITIQGSIGRVAITQYDAYIDRTLLLFEEFYNEIDKTFFAYVLFMLFEIEKEKAPGGIIKTITKEVLSDFEINIPKLPEQQKIATCLSSLDEVITANSQRLALLKDHKKALMQNLFPQEGEMVPRYRFKEFEKDGEWVVKKLGELIELKGRIGYRGYTLEDIVGKGEGAISMSPSNINVFGTLSFTKSTYITWAKYEESPEIMLENGFTVLVKTGSTYGKVAFIKNLTEKTTINPQLVVLKPKKVNDYFLYLLVANESIQKQINATVVGGAIPTLSQESISNFEILVPKIKEQEKIAECLSSLNDLIISQTERIEQLKLHKKGLMQGLFPKIQD
jgi:type I restriction enzyme S subunit